MKGVPEHAFCVEEVTIDIVLQCNRPTFNSCLSLKPTMKSAVIVFPNITIRYDYMTVISHDGFSGSHGLHKCESRIMSAEDFQALLRKFEVSSNVQILDMQHQEVQLKSLPSGSQLKFHCLLQRDEGQISPTFSQMIKFIERCNFLSLAVEVSLYHTLDAVSCYMWALHPH